MDRNTDDRHTDEQSYKNEQTYRWTHIQMDTHVNRQTYKWTDIQMKRQIEMDKHADEHTYRLQIYPKHTIVLQDI